MITLKKNVCVLFLCFCVIGFIPEIVNGFPTYYGNEYRRSASKEYLEPTEVQNAMCNIVTDQIKATANATITRQLKGVCHAKDVREQLKHIEVLLMKELHKIHRVVQGIASYQTSRKPVVFKYLSNRPSK